MRTWSVAVVPTRCGGCGQDIPNGAAFQLWRLPGLTRQLKRCGVCAEAPPPAVIGTARIAQDFKMRQTGEEG
jgi:hypothetical protein